MGRGRIQRRILRMRFDRRATQQADQYDIECPSQTQPPTVDSLLFAREGQESTWTCSPLNGGTPTPTRNSGIQAGEFPLSVWLASGTIIALRKASAPNHDAGATSRGEQAPERYAYAAVHRDGGTSWAPALSA